VLFDKNYNFKYELRIGKLPAKKDEYSVDQKLLLGDLSQCKTVFH